MKDLDVIGARSKAWPIRSGKDQVRLIASGVHAAPKEEFTTKPPQQSATVNTSTTTNGEHKRMSRDPHATLDIYEEIPPESNPETPRAAIIPPRASAKPPPRNYHELFVGNESDSSPSSASKGKSFSGGPRTAEEPISTKGGAGRHYQPSRLFDEDTSQSGNGAEEKIKVNPKKYQHFDLAGEGETGQTKQSEATKAKAAKKMSQWDFEDFVTPQKPVQRLRSQDVRHFGWSDDEVMDSPVKPKRTVQPRRDAETHFEFRDENTPKEDKKPLHRAKGTSHHDGLDLYQNNVYNEEDETEGSTNNKANAKQNHQQPLGNVTNINNHRKTFGSQFTMGDDSPVSQENNSNNVAEKKLSMPADRRAAVKMMNSSWDNYDESPEQQQQQSKENVVLMNKKTGGDGMGGRVGLQRTWGIGDDSGGEEVHHEPSRGGPKSHQSATGSNVGGGSSSSGAGGAGGGGGRFWDF